MSIKDVQHFWDSRPCNIRHSDKEIGTVDYFLDVSKKKYLVEPHILSFADFPQWKDKHVLEVGCGIGTAAQSFAECGAHYTGIDLSPESVKIAQKRFDLFNLKGDITVANIETYYDGTQDACDCGNLYDLVYSFGVLHHTPDINISIKNIYHLMKPGGTFKLMLYAKDSWKNFMIQDGLDQYEAQANCPIANTYTHDEVRSLLENFSDIQIEQCHIFPYKIEEYKRNIYVKQDYFECMSQELFTCLEKNMGWHLCITCKK